MADIKSLDDIFNDDTFGVLETEKEEADIHTHRRNHIYMVQLLDSVWYLI